LVIAAKYTGEVLFPQKLLAKAAVSVYNIPRLKKFSTPGWRNWQTQRTLWHDLPFIAAEEMF
jgi:hypothetical protein